MCNSSLSASLCVGAGVLLLSSSLLAQNIDIQSGDGLLSVRASNTSASALADALSEQLGIVVVVTGNTEALVNVDIVEEPLEKAIGKLSPNNMLVRAGNAGDGDITEVVLMMGDASGSAAADNGTDQFLPSGSPAEGVAVGGDAQNPQGSDGAALRDPNRAQVVRDAAAAASNDAGLPADVAFDPVTGLPIDPTTGLPLQPQ